MEKEMTVWGVGPKFTLYSVLYLILALVIHYVCYPRFAIQGIPYVVFAVIGLGLVAVGFPIWSMASKTVDRGFEEGVLLTQGVYALCRHPIYGNAIFFTIPGILLFFRSWLLLTVPVFMYVAFKLLVGAEEDHLREKFGPAYREYEREVNAAFPRLWKLRGAFFYPLATGQITPHVYAIRDKDVNVFICTDGTHAIAIDAGYSQDALREEMKQLPIAPEAVMHLFLTHSDHDHTGGLGLFKNAQVYLGKDEEQMIDGTASRLLWVYHNPKMGRPYSLLADGDVVTVGAIKVRAIATPGHTPGSMSYLVNDSALFTGDTLTLQNGHVHTFYHPFNMDTATQRQSIRKLAALESISLLCTAHTGCTGDFEKAVKLWRE
jgi:hydroxyacylglutathione hydrolase